MAVDKPQAPKLNVEEYLTTALSATPAELHPFFESFQDLHSRKYVAFKAITFVSNMATDYGIN